MENPTVSKSFQIRWISETRRLGADHLTLEGGVGWFLVIKNFFFLAIWWTGYFFPFFPISFLLHLCCMQVFSSDKRLQEIFFKITHPPQELNDRPRIDLALMILNFIPANSAKWGKMLDVNIQKTINKLTSEKKTTKARINAKKKWYHRSAMSAWNPGVEYVFWTSEFKNCLPKF